MSIKFILLSPDNYISSENCDAFFLKPIIWDDFGFKTLFSMVLCDKDGNQKVIGNVKIGFIGQTIGWTTEKLPKYFDKLPDNYFSVGQDADYYKIIKEELSDILAKEVLESMRDVAYDESVFEIAKIESSFNSSLTRTVDFSSIKNQFRNILNGSSELTSYKFQYNHPPSDDYSGVSLSFNVNPERKPSSNIHILIGRNGVGKTTILNNMVETLVTKKENNNTSKSFFENTIFGFSSTLPTNYFAGVVSVSFSAFDPFTPPDDQIDTNIGMRYYYIGLKKRKKGKSLSLKSIDDLCLELILSLEICFSLIHKEKRWENAVKKLESDSNFKDMNLTKLIEIYKTDNSANKSIFKDMLDRQFKKMSSGHAIVLLTITKLIETVEEKTLVLLDEPESHLHPPLLSAFTRALSDLLINRNGVAIIATHSPVVLQEVPKSCVSIISRKRLKSQVDKPEIETFAENVGILTREVFGLEVSKSGFHDLLKISVDSGRSYEDIESDYSNQIGFEGKALLQAMIFSRDSKGNM